MFTLDFIWRKKNMHTLFISEGYRSLFIYFEFQMKKYQICQSFFAQFNQIYRSDFSLIEFWTRNFFYYRFFNAILNINIRSWCMYHVYHLKHHLAFFFIVIVCVKQIWNFKISNLLVERFKSFLLKIVNANISFVFISFVKNDLTIITSCPQCS